MNLQNNTLIKEKKNNIQTKQKTVYASCSTQTIA